MHPTLLSSESAYGAPSSPHLPLLFIVEDDPSILAVYNRLLSLPRVRPHTRLVYNHPKPFFEKLQDLPHPQDAFYIFDNNIVAEHDNPNNTLSERRSYFFELAQTTEERGVPRDQIALVSTDELPIVPGFAPSFLKLRKPFELPEFISLVNGGLERVLQRREQQAA
jgi:hypothetical protein